MSSTKKFCRNRTPPIAVHTPLLRHTLRLDKAQKLGLTLCMRYTPARLAVVAFANTATPRLERPSLRLLGVDNDSTVMANTGAHL